MTQKNVDQTCALTRFREIYKRMKAEGATVQELLPVALAMAAEERRRDMARRERRARRQPRVEPVSPANGSTLRRLIHKDL